MLQARDLMPMFTATNHVDEQFVAYRDVWQRRNLLLISIPRDLLTTPEAESFLAYARAAAEPDTMFIVTSDTLPGVPSPGAVIADRWGEVYYTAAGDRVVDLPGADALTEWLRFVQHACPECQGEAR
jgi:hypothetical protein